MLRRRTTGRVGIPCALLLGLALTVAADAPSTRPAAVPAVYLDDKDARRLTPDGVERLRRAAVLADPGGREVWFVAVMYFRPTMFRAVAYYTPDQASPRLRKGKCALFTRSMDKPRSVDSYVQVSPAAKPFGETLEVPPVADFPFFPPRNDDGRPVPLADDEVVRLVDAARAIFDEAGMKQSGPPYRIEVRDENEFRVYFGVPPDGGNVIGLRHSAGGYVKAEGWDGFWVN